MKYTKKINSVVFGDYSNLIENFKLKPDVQIIHRNKFFYVDRAESTRYHSYH